MDSAQHSPEITDSVLPATESNHFLANSPLCCSLLYKGDFCSPGMTAMQWDHKYELALICQEPSCPSIQSSLVTKGCIKTSNKAGLCSRMKWSLQKHGESWGSRGQDGKGDDHTAKLLQTNCMQRKLLYLPPLARLALSQAPGRCQSHVRTLQLPGSLVVMPHQRPHPDGWASSRPPAAPSHHEGPGIWASWSSLMGQPHFQNQVQTSGQD